MIELKLEVLVLVLSEFILAGWCLGYMSYRAIHIWLRREIGVATVEKE